MEHSAKRQDVAHIEELKLWMSVLSQPGYSGTSAAARNVIAADIQQRMAVHSGGRHGGHATKVQAAIDCHADGSALTLPRDGRAG